MLRTAAALVECPPFGCTPSECYHKSSFPRQCPAAEAIRLVAIQEAVASFRGQQIPTPWVWSTPPPRHRFHNTEPQKKDRQRVNQSFFFLRCLFNFPNGLLILFTRFRVDISPLEIAVLILPLQNLRRPKQLSLLCCFRPEFDARKVTLVLLIFHAPLF